MALIKELIVVSNDNDLSSQIISILHSYSKIKIQTKDALNGLDNCVLIIDLDLFPDKTIISTYTAKNIVIAISNENSYSFYQSMLSLKVFDYILKPLNENQLISIMQRIFRPERKITVGFIGARGGVGSTTIASYSAATIIQRRFNRVELIDLDRNYGTIDIVMETHDNLISSNISKIPANTSEDPESYIIQYGANAHILTSNQRIPQPISLQSAVNYANKLDADIILLDIPYYLVNALSMIENLDILIITTELTISCARTIREILNAIKNYHKSVKMIVVANKVGAGNISPSEFQAISSISVDILLNYDPELSFNVAGTDIATFMQNSQEIKNRINQLCSYILPK